MAALPEPPSDSRPPFWDYWRHDLWSRAQREPAERFMDWPCIRHTMLVEHFPVEEQLAYLRGDADRWLPVVADADNAVNQRNLIHQAYHLKVWEDTTGLRVNELNKIYEFGGGYGAMALVARRLGFTGWYYIHDLPEFALLQKWWLKTQGVARVAHTELPFDVDLFIGIYSLSEIPLAQRRQWLGRAGSYLLLYSGQFAEFDNHAWARQVIAESHNETAFLAWRLIQFPGRPDWYAIGWPE